MNRKSTFGAFVSASLLAVLLLIAQQAAAQITFRAASSASLQSVTGGVKFQAAGTAVGGTGTVSPAWPAHAVNDIGLLFCESANQNITLTTANGFAAVTNSPQGTGVAAGATSTRLHVFWARASSSAMVAPLVADPGDHVYCQILTYRGAVTTGNPWDVTAGGTKAVASTTVTVTGVTTSVANTLVVQAVAHNIDSAAAQFGPPTNTSITFTTRVDAGSTAGNGGGIAVWDGDWGTAAATGSTTATVGNSVNAFLTIALVPATAPSPKFQALGTGVGNTGAVAPAWPTHAVDDIGLLFCESANQNITLTTANGFQAVATGVGTGTAAGLTSTRLHVFWARATSAAMAAPTVADPGDHVYCQIATYRDVVATGNPFDDIVTGTKATTSTSVTVTGVTTTVPNTLVVQGVSHNIDSAAAQFSAVSNASLTAFAERADAGSTAGNGGGILIVDGVMSTAGATADTTATVTNSVNAFFSMALLPATPRVAVPTGTVAGDLMIASVAVTPSTTNITAPSGWTAQAATVQSTATSSRQQIFYRVASAGDAAGGVSYQWTFDGASVGAVAAIASYSGVDTVSASPIDVISGNTTPVGTSHTATGVTTNVPNTMVIGSFAFASSETWTVPGGMTARVNLSSEGVSSTLGMSLLMAEVAQSGAGATGNKTATVGANGDAGTAQLLALRPAYTHYAISAVTTTVANCDYAEITISAHAANDSLAAPSGTRTVQLSLSTGGTTAAWQSPVVSGTGTWTPGANGTASYAWPGTEATFTVRLRQSAVVSLSVNLTDQGSITEQGGAEDPTFSFVNSAFRISDGLNNPQSIGTQISGKPSNTGFGSQTLYLQAVRTDTSTGACTTVFANGADVAIQVGAQCINPASCARNVTLTTSSPSSNSGSFIPAGAASFPATINFRFNTANAEAPFSFSYADAGQIRLQFNYVTSAPAVTITGNSNNFVARPFGLAFPGVQHGNTATAGLLVPAGDNFSATVTAYQWASGEDANNDGNPDSGANITDNGTVPNFAATATITPSANLPGTALGSVSRGATCALANTIALSGGTVTANDWCYSEVGNVLLKADVTDYITSGVNVTGDSSNDGGGGASGYVGRFRPKQFALSVGSITNRAALGCSPASSFTYLGERIDLGFTLTAQNTQGATTTNYTGAYAKLNLTTTDDLSVFNLGARSGTTNLTSRLNTTTGTASSGSWSNGVAANVNVRTSVARSTSPDGPFIATSFGIAPTSEGASMTGLDLDVDNNAVNDHKSLGVTSELRFGRMRLQNALASSGALVLRVPFEIQYWDGTAFVINGTDSCSQLLATDVGLSSQTFSPAGSTTVQSVTMSSPSTGRGVIQLGAPGAGNSGFAVVTPDLTLGTPSKTYLQGNWGGSATWNVNPSARASWGLFGSQPQNFIYQRENY